MGMLDRMRDKGRTDPSRALESSIPELDDPPVIVRMRKVVSYMTSLVPTGAKASPIVKRISSEMLNDIVEFPPELIEMYVGQISALLSWVADGQFVEDVVYPPGFQDDDSVRRISKKCISSHCVENDHMYAVGDDS